MNQPLKKIAFIIYELIMIWTLVLILFYAKRADVYTSKQFPVSNAVFFAGDIAVIVIIFLVNRKWGERIEGFLLRRTKLLLPLTLILLLVWQLYAGYSAYFYSGWDAGKVCQNAFYVSLGQYENVSIDYFSSCPNNLFILWLYAVVIRIAKHVPYLVREYALTAFQCVLGTLSILLIYKISFDFLHSCRLAWLTYALGYIFVGLSPWYIVAYSDVTGMIIPLLILRLCQRAEMEEKAGKDTGKKDAPKEASGREKPKKRGSEGSGGLLYYGLWVPMGFLAMMGIYLKPQVTVMYIAAVLAELIASLHRPMGKRIGRFFIKFFMGLIGIAVFYLVYTAAIVPSLHLELKDGMVLGWQHYYMMGLNDEYDGVFRPEDSLFSSSFSTNEERGENDLALAEKRIQDYGVWGMARHLARKELVNYGDGTFAWAVEGGFFAGEPGWAKTPISDFLRSFIYPEEKNYDKYISCCQYLWLLLLTGSFFAVFMGRRKKSTVEDGENILKGKEEEKEPAGIDRAAKTDAVEDRAGDIKKAAAGNAGRLNGGYPDGKGPGRGGSGTGDPGRGCSGQGGKEKEKEVIQEKLLTTAILSITGLTIFELLFEARARYLLCYAPVYVMLGALGIRNICHGIERRQKKRDESQR